MAVMSVRQHKCSFLQPRQQGSSDCIIAVLLNWTLPSQVPLLLQSAQAVICADGGANRLYDELPSMVPGEDAAQLRKRYRPAAIKGDLDSIRPKIRQFYEGLGVHIIDNSDDQDTTDLQKCLAWVREQQGALGGRLDHTLSSLSTLHKHRDMNIVLWGEGNMAQLLPMGKHVIHSWPQIKGASCGLIPLAGPATVTSTGLHWDLYNSKMEMTGLVSTSNYMIADQVKVETDADILWVTEDDGSCISSLGLSQPDCGT
eukprot:jgi/Astpho2/4684/fgenesh1_pm.00067_%23_55_t